MGEKKNIIIMRLTALWALSESGLGGVMHAFKIPFTGFFLGGFAILIITLIAYYSTQTFKVIMQSTLLVILIKATASPQSPPMAYIAVAFQGLIGALLFSIIPFFRMTAISFGMIALFESATQKFIVTTLIFGKSIWEALDLFFKDILKNFSIETDVSFSFWLIFIYTIVYTIWGMILGWWGASLPAKLEQESNKIIEQYQLLIPNVDDERINLKKKRKHKMIALFFMLLFIALVFLLQGSLNKAFYAIARTIAALLILFYIVNPLVKWGMQKWFTKAKDENENVVSQLMEIIPELRTYVKPAMQMAKQHNKGLFIYKDFVLNLIVLSLYHKQN